MLIRYFGNKQEIKRTDPLVDSQHLQEQIIEKSKALIIVHNRIVQEEARYNYLKNSLVSLTQNQSLDTLPRPHITRKKMKTQTAGLATVFGGSLDEYFEATPPWEMVRPLLSLVASQGHGNEDRGYVEVARRELRRRSRAT